MSIRQHRIDDVAAQELLDRLLRRGISHVGLRNLRRNTNRNSNSERRR